MVISAQVLGFARARKRQSSSSSSVLRSRQGDGSVESRDRTETVMVKRRTGERKTVVRRRNETSDRAANEQRRARGGKERERGRKRRRILSGLVSEGSGVCLVRFGLGARIKLILLVNN